ncbi:uncharacterized, partial [Tachysurus ichikawai]
PFSSSSSATQETLRFITAASAAPVLMILFDFSSES